MLISAIRAEISELLTKRQYRTLLTDLRRIIREGKQELVNKGFAKVVWTRTAPGLACAAPPPEGR